MPRRPREPLFGVLLGGLSASWLLAACSPAVSTREPNPGATSQEDRSASTETPSCRAGGPEVCYNAIDDNCNGALDEGCGTPSGLIHIAIAWDEADADVDLNVFDPSGQLAEVARVQESGLIKLDDCPGKDNGCKGVNVENVVLQGDHALTRGLYRVAIRLEKVAGAKLPIIVHLAARLGPKSYAERVTLKREAQQVEFRWQL